MTTIPPCQMTRELRLKLALAKLLPDEIEITDLVNFKWICGAYAGEIISDTEWDYVFRLAQRKLRRFDENTWHIKAEEMLNGFGIEW